MQIEVGAEQMAHNHQTEFISKFVELLPLISVIAIIAFALIA